MQQAPLDPTGVTHQWSWDSAFVAVRRSWYDAPRARLELETLFEAQWRTGMLPSIAFDPAAPANTYYPRFGLVAVRTFARRCPRAPTSSITQPPIQARAALEVHRHAPPDQRAASLAWLARLYPRNVFYAYAYACAYARGERVS